MKTRIVGVIAASAMLAIAIFTSPALTQAGDDSKVVSTPNATITLTTFQAASVVIGQADFSGGFPNQGPAKSYLVWPRQRGESVWRTPVALCLRQGAIGR